LLFYFAILLFAFPLLFKERLMLFEKLVEQNRVHHLVTHAFYLTLVITIDQVGVYLSTSSAIRPNPSACVRLGTRRKLQGMIAKSFAAEVERFRGAKSGGSSGAKTQLVGAKLEVVRTAWLLKHVGILGRFHWLGRVDRVQRDEIH
jgi:hypothetical protein